MKQCPHEMLNGMTTRSPTASMVTSSPTSTTTPIGSWPSTSPRSMKGPNSSYRCRSEPQIALDVILTIASVGSWMIGSGTSSTETLRLPCQVSALIALPFGSSSRRVSNTATARGGALTDRRKSGMATLPRSHEQPETVHLPSLSARTQSPGYVTRTGSTSSLAGTRGSDDRTDRLIDASLVATGFSAPRAHRRCQPTHGGRGRR